MAGRCWPLVVYSMVLDSKELERELGRDFLSLDTPYRMPAKLWPMKITHVGEERIRIELDGRG